MLVLLLLISLYSVSYDLFFLTFFVSSYAFSLDFALSRLVRYRDIEFFLRCLSLSLFHSFSLFSFLLDSLVRTGDEAFYGFVLMGIQLPRRVTVNLAVHG